MKKAELTIQDIIHALLAHVILILISSLVVGVIAWAYTTYKIPKMYKATVTLFAQSAKPDESQTITNSGLNANRQLASTFSNIMHSNTVMKMAAQELKAAGLNYNYAQLKNMTTMGTTNTEIFTATISTSDRKHIKLIADTIADKGVERIKDVVVNGDVQILDYAEVPGAPYSPNVKANTITGVIIGFVLACAIVVIRALTDTTIWSEEDLSKQYKFPVLGSVPSLMTAEKQSGQKE